MSRHKIKLKSLVLGLVAAVPILGSMLGAVAVANAADKDEALGFSLSPMKENVILSPGEEYESSFTIHNPATHKKDFEYELSVTPFYVDENYQNVFVAEGNYSEMADWIKIDSPMTGSLKPNEEQEIHFTINVPQNAPGGGQYATVMVTSANPTNEGDNSAVLEKTAIAHTIFAEITGNTVRSGEVKDVTVPSFMLSGNIYGESTIKNTGNVHGKATYILKVTPLFSSEEVYTNEESPVTHDVLPNRSYYNKIEWENTPGVGIFNVTYTVDFEGEVTEVSKMVIICPIWMMILILVIIVAIIGGIVMLVRKKKQR